MGHGRRPAHDRESAAALGSHVQLGELVLQVQLQTAAIFALEGAELLDLALKLVTSLHQRAHGLTVPLLRVAFERLGAGPGVTDDLLGLATRLAENVVGLATRPGHRLVRLAAGVGDRLVRSLLGQGEHASRSVHVVLSRGHPHADGNRLLMLHRLGSAHRLRLLHHHLRLGLGDRGGRHGHAHSTGDLAPQALRQFGAELLVLLNEAVQLGLHLIKEGVYLFLVVTRPESGRTKLLVPHISGRQRHFGLLGALGVDPEDGTRSRKRGHELDQDQDHNEQHCEA